MKNIAPLSKKDFVHCLCTSDFSPVFGDQELLGTSESETLVMVSCREVLTQHAGRTQTEIYQSILSLSNHSVKNNRSSRFLLMLGCYRGCVPVSSHRKTVCVISVLDKMK